MIVVIMLMTCGLVYSQGAVTQENPGRALQGTMINIDCPKALARCERVANRCPAPSRSAVESVPPLPDVQRTANLAFSRLDAARRAIQTASRQLLLAEFGRVPDGAARRVELVIDVGDGGSKGVLHIEMAPDSEMPTTVLYFLRQVRDGLLDGAVFHRNAHHVLQGGPGPNRAKLQRLAAARGESESVAFQEYSPRFAHERHTLGLAGRPGGPDFYISLVDNTRNHGPGSQTEDAKLLGEADPCFARLVGGADVVERVHRQPVRPGGYNALVRPVTIESGRVVASLVATRAA